MDKISKPLVQFNVVTLFPDMIKNAFSEGVVGQAIQSGYVVLQTISPRVFTQDIHHTIDDRPYGGGDGMVMMYEPLKKVMESLGDKRGRTLLLSAHGQKWQDKLAREWASTIVTVNTAAHGHREVNPPIFTLICGRYGGVDQRFINEYVDAEISIGDYILSGGEPAAIVVLDSLIRLLPNVLGNEISAQNESFADGLLEAPLFTRPQSVPAGSVPKIFTSGDHSKIHKARRAISLLITKKKRPDLLTNEHERELKQISSVIKEFTHAEIKACGLDPQFVEEFSKEFNHGNK